MLHTYLPYFLIIISLILMYAGVHLFRKNLLSRLLTVILFWAVWLMSLTYIVADYFTGNGLDEAFFYHFFGDTEGAGYESFWKIIVFGIIFLLGGIYLSIRTFGIKRVIMPHIRGRDIIALILACASIVIHPFFTGIREYLDTPEVTETGADDFRQYFLTAEPKRTSPVKKNVIYIYLESFEANYLDEELFPGLAPNLRKLRDENINFSNVVQLAGLGFTMAGKVGSQCGLPLVTPGGGNSMGGMDAYLPGAFCIGDILKSQDYDMHYTGGASLKFGGKGDFYRTHGFDTVKGREELIPNATPQNVENDWGLYDEDLFERIFPDIQSLYEAKKPFGYFMLTVNTHNPHGFVDPKCSERYTDSESILNAVHCDDMLIGDFVEKLQASGVLKDTLLVIGSDHLSLPNDVTKRLEKKERKNLLIMIDGDTQETIFRKASTMDIGATLLSKLNISVKGVGFGRNLYDQTNKTLAETFPDPRADLKWKYDLKQFWGYPKFSDPISILLDESKVSINGRQLDIPLLANFTDDGTMKNIWFQFDSPEKLGIFYTDLAANERLVWVDYCTALPRFWRTSEAKYCLLSGKKGSEKFTPLTSDITFEPLGD